MKKIALIAAGALVLAGAGWSALWYLGRGEVTAALALETERLAERGIAVTWSAERVGGFPLGYTLTLEDVSVTAEGAGAALAIPSLVARLDASAPDSVTVALPPEMVLTLSEDEEAPRRIDIESEALSLLLAEPAEGAREFRVTARSLLAVEAVGEAEAEDHDGVSGVATELAGLDATLAVEPPADGAAAVLTARAERLESIITGGGRRGELSAPFTYAVDAQAAAPLLTARLVLDRRPLAVAAAEGFAGLPLRATLQAGVTEVVTATAASGGGSSLLPEGDGADGRFTLGFGTAAGVLSLTDGALDTQLTLEAAKIVAEPSAAEANFRGPVDINRVDLAYRAPTAPAEAMSPLGLRIAAAEVMPAASVWAALDPAGALDQSPMELVFEIEGTVRLTEEGASLPAELGNLTVKHGHFRALGTVFDATGALEFIQPQMLPIGALELRALNSMQTLRDLVQADLLEPASAETAMLLAANYARAGETPEELLATIDFSETGIMLNGLPLAGPVGAIRAPRDRVIELPGDLHGGGAEDGAGEGRGDDVPATGEEPVAPVD
ncbi:MAG: DUF2125 domain-containing protein [Pseudomonadota bacterium]